MIRKICYVICSEDESVFFLNGSYFAPDPFKATPFSTKDEAMAWKISALSSFQKEILTKVIPIEISIRFIREE